MQKYGFLLNCMEFYTIYTSSTLLTGSFTRQSQFLHPSLPFARKAIPPNSFHFQLFSKHGYFFPLRLLMDFFLTTPGYDPLLTFSLPAPYLLLLSSGLFSAIWKGEVLKNVKPGRRTGRAGMLKNRKRDRRFFHLIYYSYFCARMKIPPQATHHES